MSTATDPAEFVRAVSPFLGAQDAAGLVARLRAGWSPDQLADLLGSTNRDARKVAALSLGLIGGRPAVEPLCRRLADADEMVRQMAEHAVWSVWFRLGATPAANDALGRGAQALAARHFDRAVDHLGRAIEADPSFAEAYNQRAIVHYLRDEYAASLADCRRAVELMPTHFGALAGMGHCHVHLDQPRNALRAYRRALAVHPHMDGVRESAVALCRQLRGQCG